MASSLISARLSPTASSRLVVLAEAVVKAGETARVSLRRRTSREMLAKAPRDYQTEIDVAVERIIVDEMTKAFPDYAIQGEEAVGNRTAGPDAPIIYIDPIDGTTNYAWGVPHFGMTIAIAEGGSLVAGVVYDAMQDELFSAERGGGAYLDGERIRCADVGDIENVLIGAGLPVPGQVKAVAEETYFDAIKRLMANTAGVRRLGSAALSIAYVACGRLDGFFEDGLSIHDFGASALMVEEAGGIVTRFSGAEVDGKGDILAASKALHPWLKQGFQGKA
ncbi:inositol 1-phosphatase 2 (plasmid) [Rhizobium phaseoli]|uniref:Inositol-1-monophosphatase n=1 Tax=Rhizobium etli (strain ATCC 51251 / DSM 11541 / JCM 21823 / NBRC 15573 / CFN 42) TaxID=347834 RepID=Q2K236_RHIEC|nr:MULTISPECIES: inositol monophosphatase family protein [Rhizobium]ABC93153.1 myo-inositol-1(or 4)-monophosphatase protein [Rhizobium etli CFN 42]AGS24071.1 inositol 1-phosphatase 2 [Rhizobium etli bv. mimosae str. Mim1]ANL44469.1 inositol 1-phosphatase 2 [Rhizobium phaseoli]ANL63433.1 inositol 1-phosphatase 2 [Rhizobium phaseoli]ANL75628.1 inositol 1-phosphatase 2 [Rhizobium phaseoli]